MIGHKIKDVNIAQQVASIKTKYSGFNVTFGPSSMKVIGEIQPTPRSEVYIIELKFKLHDVPRVHVLRPELIVNFKGDKIPHVYPGNRLCLYQPKYNEFKRGSYLSDTIIPWTSLWLYHYEVWHNTGDWKGGGEHPKTKEDA